MRETCARVLAAALMTGAIATAMGLPTVFGSADEHRGALISPPSSQQRSVRLVALPAPKRPVRAEPRVAVQEPRTTLIRRPVVTPTPVRPRPTPAPKPKPKAAPKPERELAATPSAPQPPPAIVPPADPTVAEPPPIEDTHGHAYGHDKHDETDKGKKEKPKD